MKKSNLKHFQEQLVKQGKNRILIRIFGFRKINNINKKRFNDLEMWIQWKIYHRINNKDSHKTYLNIEGLISSKDKTIDYRKRWINFSKKSYTTNKW